VPSRTAQRKGKRRRPHRSQRVRPPGPYARFDGVPVYDGTMVHNVDVIADHADGSSEHVDTRTLLAIGPEGGRPVAYVMLCPCDGVRGLVEDLQGAAAAAAEFHPPHEHAGSWHPVRLAA
jgi:hypothetical protein